jgi:general secretion pathway protein L
MVSIIDEVTRRIPDQSWLTSYAYQDGMIKLTGYSDDPSNLLRQLEMSEMFSDVRFAAPVTMDSRVERERFNISMTVVAARAGQ